MIISDGAEDTFMGPVYLGQNVPAARDFATDSKISAVYFALKEGDMRVLNTTILQKIGKCHNIAKTNSPNTTIIINYCIKLWRTLENLNVVFLILPQMLKIHILQVQRM